MTAVSPALPTARLTTPPPIRVMVVDDAIVVRSLVARWVGDEPDLEIVAALRNGVEAVNEVEQADPDVVIMDVDMPELDGIASLPLLFAKKPDLVVIMASSLTRRNAEVSLKALSLGAADYIPKPEAEGGIMTSTTFRRELIEKIRALGGRRLRRVLSEPHPRSEIVAPSIAPEVIDPKHLFNRLYPEGRGKVQLRPFSLVPPRVLLIGASTGGPQALLDLLPKIQPVMNSAPVLITQHMPPTFTIILSENLARACGRPVHEAINGEHVLPGTVYLAPGGRHMQVVRRNGAPSIALDDGPPINFCKPSVDPLFSSASEVWGPGSLAIVLTGMGSDGTRGAADIVAVGGSIIAQDEATSVIWGMPGSVAEAGLCSAVLPIEEMANVTAKLFQGRRP